MKSIKKAYLFVALMLIFFCFAPIISVNAWGQHAKVTYRPLSDWTLNNPRVVLGYTTNWDLLPEGWVIRPNFAVEDTGQYYGYIREEELDDGQAELTVYLYGKNSPRSVYQLQEWFDFFGGEQFPGEILENLNMDFFAEYKFILPGPGQPIPFEFAITEWISGIIVGIASGTFTEHAGEFGFTASKEGIVFLLQSFYVDELGDWVWPYEIVDFYEVD